jgi:hypothetical protein
MHVLIAFVVGVFAGGYGGYRWGASVERKAAAKLAALQSTIVNTVNKI